jgi:hypothetical protein
MEMREFRLGHFMEIIALDISYPRKLTCLIWSFKMLVMGY